MIDRIINVILLVNLIMSFSLINKVYQNNEKMKQIYYDNCEVIDFKELQQFNERTHYFKQLQLNPFGSHLDITGINRIGIPCQIELKLRDNDIFAFPTIFVEPSKVDAAKECTKEEVYYVNFFYNSNKVIIYNLKRIDWDTIEKKWVDIYDKGAEKRKYVERYLLPLSEGTIFIYNRDNNNYDIFVSYANNKFRKAKKAS